MITNELWIFLKLFTYIEIYRQLAIYMSRQTHLLLVNLQEALSQN